MSLCEIITRNMVAIESISRKSKNSGENRMAEYIENTLSGFGLEILSRTNYRRHAQLTDGRRNSYALLRSPSCTTKTLIFIGHIDTVGVNDYAVYGSNDIAFDPDKLAILMNDNDCLYGRGALDMKSGLAAQICALKAISDYGKSAHGKTETFPGNILMISTPDEENESAGIKQAMKFLKSLSAHEGFEYVGIVNSDYTSERYAGDKNRYIYFGTVGKLLVSATAFGIPTHAGDVYAGINSTLLLSEFIRSVEISPDLIESCSINGFNGATNPPTVLHISDSKDFYDVTMPKYAFADINITTLSRTPNDVIDLLKAKANQAVSTAYQYIGKSCRAFSERNNIPDAISDAIPDANIRFQQMSQQISQPMAFTYSELYQKASDNSPNFDDILMLKLHGTLDRFRQKHGRYPDARELTNQIVRITLEELHPEMRAGLVLSFAPPYYAHKAGLGSPLDEVFEQSLVSSIRQISAEFVKYDIEMRLFYPYISDLSFAGLSPEIMADYEQIQQNSPVSLMQKGAKGAIKNKGYGLSNNTLELNVPIVNIGPYGYDAHKNTERVEKKYSFEVLPRLLESVAMDYLKRICG